MEKEQSFYFNDNIQPIINKNLDKNKNQLLNYIRTYIDKNSDVLYHNAPSRRLYFTDNDKNVIFKVIGLEKKEIAKAIKENPYVDASWKVLTQPYFWGLLMSARYFLVNNKEKEMQQVLMYLTLSFYSSIQYKNFPKFLPNDNIMTYTINNLSNKFDIKKFGTVFELLYNTMMVNHNTYKNDFKVGDDLALKNYLMTLRTRINSKIQNITREYEKNRKSGNYFNSDEEDQDPENFRELDNASFEIRKLSDKITRVIVSSSVDDKILRISAESNKINKMILKTALQNIIRNKTKDVDKLVILILQMYIIGTDNEPKTIKSTKYIAECINAYSKSNTNDQVIIDMKKLLDEWLNDSSDMYLKTERVATKSSFRRAIFLYFVFMIQKAS